MADNLIVNVSGRGLERLTAAISLCRWTEADEARFSGWEITPDNHIVFALFQVSNKLPVEIDAAQAAQMAFEYIQKLSHKEFPLKQDIDGSQERGWFLSAEQDRVKIAPHWMIYHK